MPLIAWLWVAGAAGVFGLGMAAGSAVDDALEGQNKQVNTLGILAVIAAIAWIYVRKPGASGGVTINNG